jgi:hypothetical protein
MIRFVLSLFVCLVLIGLVGCSKGANAGGAGGGGNVGGGGGVRFNDGDMRNQIRLDRLQVENERALHNGF